MALKERRASDWDEWSGCAYIHISEKRDEPLFGATTTAVKRELISPSSAKFEDTAQILRNGDSSRVRISVDSQNKYGAVIRSKWEVVLTRYKSDKYEWWSAKSVKMIETSEK